MVLRSLAEGYRRESWLGMACSFGQACYVGLMEQLELFQGDMRKCLLPKDKMWIIYDNPTPYQEECNNLYYEIHEILKRKEASK